MLVANNLDSDKNNALPQKKILDNPSYYLNRELSWIRFNGRVLEEARDLWHPLLERVKFVAICGSNLDEFFMTRVARLIKKVKVCSEEKAMDGMSFMEQIDATRKEILPLIENHAKCWKDELVPALVKEGIYVRNFKDLPEKNKAELRELFKVVIAPSIKVPKVGFDSVSIENLHVTLYISGFQNQPNFCVLLDVPTEKFGRLINIPKKGNVETCRNVESKEGNFVLLEDLIINNLETICPTEKNLTAYSFRLTRNGEIDIRMDESADFIKSIQRSLSTRKTGFPTRIEFDKKTPNAIRQTITKKVGLPDYLIYEFDGPLGLVDLWQLLKINRPDLKDRSFFPCISPLVISENNIFETISKQDFVLYHPYDGFDVIIDLLREAATEYDVLEICITMYRMAR